MGGGVGAGVRALLQERAVRGFESTEQGRSLAGLVGSESCRTGRGATGGGEVRRGPLGEKTLSWEGRGGNLLRFTWAPPSRLERLSREAVGAGGWIRGLQMPCWPPALGSPELLGNFQNDRFIDSLKDLLSQNLWSKAGSA